MTKRLFYKLGNMRDLASFCLFGIRLALSLYFGGMRMGTVRKL